MQSNNKVTAMFALIIAEEAKALYGDTAVVSHFFGGFIADKWKPKKLLSLSLFLIAIGHFWMTLIPSIFTLKILYVFWGVSTILLFWASSIKATRKIGNKHNHGLSFGLLDGGRGFFAASITLFLASILTYFFSEKGVEITFSNKVETLQHINGSITTIVFLVALFIWKTLPNELVKFETRKEFQFNLKKLFI
jgi:MFS family permease